MKDVVYEDMEPATHRAILTGRLTNLEVQHAQAKVEAQDAELRHDTAAYEDAARRADGLADEITAVRKQRSELGDADDA